ncbi:MAG: DotU family type IV/VI secretion system protein [Gammaproteobacteria bacterium]|nr:DotU family type IV/VI secretion system protein [Gammaproteobacteria bacterium]
MRIVDCFTDAILYARKLARGDIQVASADEARTNLMSLLDKSKTMSEEYAISSEMLEQAKFPVVAFVDELFLCSNWAYKSEWKTNTLQRLCFNTTSAGSAFYDRLNELNKFGPDRDIREIYALCLGLGFRGKYFRGEDRQRYEEIKAFNLSVILPDESEQDIDSATLFPFAYRGHSLDKSSGYQPRLNIYPVLIGLPVTIIVIMMLYFGFDIAATLNEIQQLVKY